MPLTSRPWISYAQEIARLTPHSGLDVGPCSVLCSDGVGIWIVAYLSRVSVNLSRGKGWAPKRIQLADI